MIIDIECDLPTKEVAQAGLDNLLAGERKGLINYFNLFGPRWAADAGMSLEEFEEAKKTMELEKLARVITEKSLAKCMTNEEFIRMLDDAGVTVACIGTGRAASMEHTASLARQYKGRLIPWVRISPSEGMAGVRRLEYGVKELGIKGFVVSPFREKIYVNDKKYYPYFAKCVELGIPIRSHTSMNYGNDRAMDLGRPIYLDEVARDFPELVIIAGLGGWPWVPELVGLVRRHPNVYMDLAAHRPKYISKPGSGFEMVLQFGNTVIQDKVLFASSNMTLGMPLKDVIREMDELPLKDSVRRKWMYDNAARVLKLG